MNSLLTLAGLGIISMILEMLKIRKPLHFLIPVGLALAIFFVWADFGTSFSYFHNMVVFDNYALAFAGLLLIISLLWIFMSGNFFSNEAVLADRYSLILFTLAGAVVMVSFADLTMFFIGLEILSISMYVLCGSDKLNLRSNESALKYFMMGAFATGFLLFGIALLYGVTSSFNLAVIASYVSENHAILPEMFYAGLALILVGLLFKVSAAPFHFWAPDVYEGAPTPVTAFMATIVKTAAFAAFYRLFSTCFSSVFTWWTDVIAVISALTMLLGNITAVYQTSVKRMLAYSSIAHAGYMLMALVALNQSSKGSLLLYTAAYSVSTIGIFSVLNYMNRHNIDDQVNSFRGLGKANPFVAVMITVLTLSLAGIPPVAGFFAKYYIFYAALKSDYLWLVMVAVFSSLVGVYYYFRIIIAMFTGETSHSAFSFSRPDLAILLVCSIITLLLGVIPGWLISLV